MAHIFLYGPPASGKSTVGEALARQLRLAFVDLDSAIESDANMPISQIIATRGESGFRDLESRLLEMQMDQSESVIALGGGSLLRDANRRLAEDRGRVLCLQAEPRLLLERLRLDSRPRPLLAGDLEAKLAALLEERRDHYNSFALQLDANLESAQMVWQIETSIGRFHLSAMGEYEAIVQVCLTAELRRLMLQLV